MNLRIKPLKLKVIAAIIIDTFLFFTLVLVSYAVFSIPARAENVDCSPDAAALIDSNPFWLTATSTPGPCPTDTPSFTPTDTLEPTSTDTLVPTPTDTLEPTPTDTLEPTPTDTLEPTPTDTPEPTPTDSQEPSPTSTLKPSATSTLILPSPTNTLEPSATSTLVLPSPTSSSAPSATPTRQPTSTQTATDAPSRTPNSTSTPRAKTSTPAASSTPKVNTPTPTATPRSKTSTPAASSTPIVNTPTPTITSTAEGTCSTCYLVKHFNELIISGFYTADLLNTEEISSTFNVSITLFDVYKGTVIGRTLDLQDVQPTGQVLHVESRLWCITPVIGDVYWIHTQATAQKNTGEFWFVIDEWVRFNPQRAR